MPKLSTLNLTPTRIQRAKVGKNEEGAPQVSYLWDAEVPGFGVRINTTGNKSFVMKYRNPEGKQAWMVLGEYTGEESLVQAKETAKEYRKVIKKKIDPKTGIQQALERPTFKKFVESFLELQEPQVSESYQKASNYFLNRVSVPQIGSLRMDLIEQRHVSDLLDGYLLGKRPWLGEGELEPPAKTNYNRFRGVLSVVFKAAEEKGIRPRNSNPVTYIKKLSAPPRRKRYLTGEELSWLGKVLKDAPKWDDRKACPYSFNEKGEHLIIPSPYAIAAIELLLLTGARKTEILRLRWDGISKTKKTITIEDHKTSGTIGAKELPLTPAVLSVIERLEKLPTRRLAGDWVIQGHNLDAPMVNINKPWSRLQEAVKRVSKGACNIDDVNIHVLRHSFASVGVSQGVGLFIVGKLLGHTNASTTERYAHLLLDPQMQASTQISEHISELMGS